MSLALNIAVAIATFLLVLIVCAATLVVPLGTAIIVGFAAATLVYWALNRKPQS